ncbi:hypothetical protein [Frateuria defendens]|uniref:hypothetical protein n=1 Tax=Frateuria defendens TaxID=2219559 RepID=UPI00066FFA79|nr:hypothetical protein [Frateuria defendens]
MYMSLRLLVAMALLVACGHLCAAAPTVTLASGAKVQLTDNALAPLQKRSVTATSHGKTASYEGYDLLAVLRAAGVEPVESLRGKHLGATVAVSAADGYRVVFSLAELDPTLGNKQVFLVDRENGQALPSGDGPWRLVVPSDRRPARWVRQVVSMVMSGP